MRQLGELNANGAMEFEKLGVEVVAVFREEREGLAGLQKVKASTRVPFTLALDTPANATAAYSNGRKEFSNYVVDKTGVIRGIVNGSLKNRAKASKLVEIVKSVESDSAGMADSTGLASAGDQVAVKQAVMDYVAGVHQGKMELIQRAVHPGMKMFAFADASMSQAMEKNYSQLAESVANHKATVGMRQHSPHVQVLDVSGNLASAKLTSPKGTAMMNLVKKDGKWMIIQALSQQNQN